MNIRTGQLYEYAGQYIYVAWLGTHYFIPIVFNTLEEHMCYMLTFSAKNLCTSQFHLIDTYEYIFEHARLINETSC